MNRRQGLTIVEMLVATALVMFIMVILSEAFVQGLNAFHELKAVGDMNIKLRATLNILQADLDNVRVESPPGTVLRLSQLAAIPPPAGGRGFFRVMQDQPDFFSSTDVPNPPYPSPPYDGAGNLLPPNPPSTGNGDFIILTPAASPNTIKVGTVLLVDSGASLEATQEVVQVNFVDPNNPNRVRAVFSRSHVVNRLPLTMGGAALPPIPFPVVVCEGWDLADRVPVVRSSPRSTTDGHMLGNSILHFTVYNARALRREDYFQASFPGLVAAPNTTITADNATQTGLDWQTTRAYYAANSYSSPWAEVAYFLVQQDSTPGGTPLYALYRRQLVVAEAAAGGTAGTLNTAQRVLRYVPDPSGVIVDQLRTISRQISCRRDLSTAPPNPGPEYIYFNSPTDLTVPGNRIQPPPYPLAMALQQNGLQTYLPIQDANNPRSDVDNPAQRVGSDILLTDVLSFDVQAIFNNSPDFGYLTPGPGPVPPVGRNPNFVNIRLFDTWSQEAPNAAVTGSILNYSLGRWDYTLNPGLAENIPFNGTLQGLQISLRVWDAKSKKSRQVTMITNM